MWTADDRIQVLLASRRCPRQLLRLQSNLQWVTGLGLVDRHGARICLPLAQLAFAAALLAFAASRRLQRGALYAEVVAIFFCLRSRKTAGRLGLNQLPCASTELNTRKVENVPQLSRGFESFIRSQTHRALHMSNVSSTRSMCLILLPSLADEVSLPRCIGHVP